MWLAVDDEGSHAPGDPCTVGRTRKLGGPFLQELLIADVTETTALGYARANVVKFTETTLVRSHTVRRGALLALLLRPSVQKPR
jgi:hypothetical protein